MSSISSESDVQPLLRDDTINQRVKVMEYAVRGPIPIRATQLAKELEAGVQHPFDEVIRANIGDCHAMNQKPITFFRFILGLTLENPFSLSVLECRFVSVT